jgi:hypothetical protein
MILKSKHNYLSEIRYRVVCPDVIIVCSGMEPVRADRIVLAAVSDFLKALLLDHDARDEQIFLVITFLFFFCFAKFTDFKAILE